MYVIWMTAQTSNIYIGFVGSSGDFIKPNEVVEVSHEYNLANRLSWVDGILTITEDKEDDILLRLIKRVLAKWSNEGLDLEWPGSSYQLDSGRVVEVMLCTYNEDNNILMLYVVAGE